MKLPAVISFVLMLTVPGCLNAPERSENAAVEAALADSLARITEATDIDLTIYEDHHAAVQLKAETARTYEKDDGHTETVFEGDVRIVLTDSSQTRTLTRSEKVLYQSPETVFTLIGSVIVEGIANRTLRTDTLIWDRTQNRVYTDGYVILTTEKDSIYGYGLRGVSDLSDYSLLRISGSVSRKKP